MKKIAMIPFAATSMRALVADTGVKGHLGDLDYCDHPDGLTPHPTSVSV